MMLKALESLKTFFFFSPLDFSQIAVDQVTTWIFEVLGLREDFSQR